MRGKVDRLQDKICLRIKLDRRDHYLFFREIYNLKVTNIP